MAFISLRSSLRILWTATVALVFLTSSSAAPTFGNADNAMMYLARYGYLSPSVANPSSAHLMDEGTWKRAVAEFQSFAGLNATGELDEETTKVMSLPRCGIQDKMGSSGSQVNRYELLGSKWRNKHLTYRISKYTSRLSRAQVEQEIARAFAVWSDYTDLTFTLKRYGDVDIDIRFEKGAHGDGHPFDGPLGVLAHAFDPKDGGDAHFDDAEIWTINSLRGTNLFQTAAHEFGHALGLSHSGVQSALMAPFYRGYEPAFRLHQDDINGIQALYGRKSQTGHRGLVPALPKPFPRCTAWWLGCSSAPRGTVPGNARLSDINSNSDDDGGDILFEASRRTPRPRYDKAIRPE